MKQTLPGKTTVKRGGSKRDASPPQVLAIRWVFPDTRGRLTRFDAARTTIGRDESCRVRLDGDDVSRLHAEVESSDRGVVLRDLGSTNGIRVDGCRYDEVVLQPGRVVRIGGWVGISLEVAHQGDSSEPEFQEASPGVFAGPVFRRSLEVARRVATSDLPLVIEGETGTGKERVAQAVHLWSGRTGPFVAINCAALPESIAEAELFGYRRGAFTGAAQASLGHFRAAEGGTLLLDEISDLPVALQAKVLRVIEQREVVPLGESRPIPIDVRLVAAAQKPLLESVQAGKFRADLFARLEGETVRLPPLRERREEIPYVFCQLMARHGGSALPRFEPELIEQLCLYHWPFNVRELDLLVRRLLARHGGEALLGCAHVPERFLSPPPAAGGPIADSPAPVSISGSLAGTRPSRCGPLEDDRDWAALRQELYACRGNLARAAAAVGISRQRAYRLIQMHPDVDLESFRGS